MLDDNVCEGHVLECVDIVCKSSVKCDECFGEYVKLAEYKFIASFMLDDDKEDGECPLGPRIRDNNADSLRLGNQGVACESRRRTRERHDANAEATYLG